MKNILLTGPPGVGKSTVVERALPQLHLKTGGFFTREIRTRGKRVGFSVETLDGRKGTLAHVDHKGPYRVGRYSVNIEDIDNIAVPSLEQAVAEADLIVVDEIGTMEAFSEKFLEAIRLALDSERPLFGVIKETNRGFIGSIKARNDVEIIQVTYQNRDQLPSLLTEKIRGMIRPQ